MNNEVIDKDIAKELLMILEVCDVDIQNKIPIELFNKLNEFSFESTKELNINPKIPLDEQNISSDTLDYLAVLYYTFLADNVEKDNIITKWVNNDKSYNN